MPTSARRRALLLALPLLATPIVRAQAPSAPLEGTDYLVLSNAQPSDTPGKIEVLDFFWYGCPHCFAVLDDFEAWRKRLPADVAYRHVPIAFDASREPHSKIFYALQVLGLVDEMHVKVFAAFHVQHRRLIDRDDIADFMVSNGIARDKWLAAYDSFSVAGMVNRARLTAQAYTVDATPTMAIDGRFLTSPSIASAHSAAGAIAVANYLIERSRHEHRRKS